MNMLLLSKVSKSSFFPDACEPITVTVKITEKPFKFKEPENDVIPIDLFASAYVSLATLGKIPSLNLSWIFLSPNESAHKESTGSENLSRRSVFRVIVSEDIPEQVNNVVYLNPVAAFNLGVVDGSRVDLSPFYFQENDKPSIVRHISIVRIRSPESSGHVEYGGALRDFFRVPRILQKGDIVAVSVDVDMKLDGFLDDSESIIDADEFEIGVASQEMEPSKVNASENADNLVMGKESDHKNSANSEISRALEAEVVSDHLLSVKGNQVKPPQNVVFFMVAKMGFNHSMDTDCKGLAGSFVGGIVDGLGGETQITQEGTVHSRVPDRRSVLRFYEHLHDSHLEISAADESQTEFTAEFEQDEVTEISSTLLTSLKTAFNSIHSVRSHRYSLLLHGEKGVGKRFMINKAANKIGVHVHEVSLTSLRGLPEDRASKKLKQILSQGIAVAPCVIHLRHFQSLVPVSQGSALPDDPEIVVDVLKTFFHPKAIVVASVRALEDVSSVLRGCFTHEMGVSPPDKLARVSIIKGSKARFSSNVDIQSLAVRTAGRTAIELQSMIANAACIALERKSKLQSSVMDDIWNGIASKGRFQNEDIHIENKELPSCLIDDEDLNTALESIAAASNVSVHQPNIMKVRWEDIGGLGDAKKEILDMVELPLRSPELFASGLRQRSGILLYGPPGTGKTLLAKAVATECSLNFISVKGPEILDMYIGESERKVRQIFATARAAKPSVLFFDELDSLAPQRGRGADSGGVMDRVVSQLLTEIDGMDGNSGVFVIGATNRPDLLDQSLLRPGRFDRLIYLGICQDRDSQLKVIKALSRKYKIDADVNFEELLDRCPFNFTGADFYALCSGAMAQALHRRVREIEEYVAKQTDPHITVRSYLSTLEEDDLIVTVKMCDYLESLANTTPSVSTNEIKYYESLKEKFGNT